MGAALMAGEVMTVPAEFQNTTVTIYRGTSTNAYGDEVDANTPIMSGVPAAVIETHNVVQDPSTPTPRVIRQITCYVSQYTGILNTDRLFDESSGDTYMILSVTRPSTLIGTPPDLRLELKRVTANAP